MPDGFIPVAIKTGEEEGGIADILIMLLPVGVALILFKDKILRMMGLKQFLIVYFNDADYESAYTLKKYLGWSADMVQLSPSAETLPPEADEYKYIILIGGQAVNPFYKKFMEAGKLPPVTSTNRKVIAKIGNMIFIAGYEASDTFDAVSEFINKYIRKK